VFESGSGCAGYEVILVILDALQGFAVHGESNRILGVSTAQSGQVDQRHAAGHGDIHGGLSKLRSHRFRISHYE
jgi:hypothetical protein